VASSPTALRYFVTLLIPVPAASVERFIEINRQAGAIYRASGADGSDVFRLADGAAKYGCVGIAGAVHVRDGEALMMVQDSFADRETFARVTAALDQNPALNALFDALLTIVDLSRAIRGEFEWVA